MYGNLFVNTQISANHRNKLQEYTQSPDKITQKYERIHSFTKRTVRSFRKFEVRVVCTGISFSLKGLAINTLVRTAADDI